MIILITITTLFLLTVLQESVATLSGTLPGLMAEGDQEEESEGIYFKIVCSPIVDYCSISTFVKC
jgi:hypothetical protein